MNKARATKDAERKGVKIISRVQDKVWNMILKDRRKSSVDNVTSC